MVSIITPAYNCEAYIEETIKTVLDQTYTDWEHIIVDDASTDSTADLISRYADADARIRLIRLTENKGVANARNVALDLAQGDYIAFLDSDDKWKPGKLERHLKFMRRRQVNFSYTPYDVIDAKGTYIKEIVPKRKEVSYRQLLQTNVMACCTIIVKRELLLGERMPSIGHEDYAMWLNVLRHTGEKAVCFPENLSVYRKLSDSVSANKWKTIGWNYHIYHSHQGLGVLQSCYYLMNFIVRTGVKYLIRK